MSTLLFNNSYAFYASKLIDVSFSAQEDRWSNGSGTFALVADNGPSSNNWIMNKEIWIYLWHLWRRVNYLTLWTGIIYYSEKYQTYCKLGT